MAMRLRNTYLACLSAQELRNTARATQLNQSMTNLISYFESLDLELGVEMPVLSSARYHQ